MDDLRNLAQKATPGPWMWDSDPVKGDPLGRERAQVVARGRTITQGYYTDLQGRDDVAFISAANPTAILVLLDERDALAAKVARLREALFSIESYCPEYTGDYTSNATLSDFGGNADDYAREMNAITDAHIGDIARAALKDTA